MTRQIIFAPLLCAVLGPLAVCADHGPGTWRVAADSVVAVLPTWPGHQRSGHGAPPGIAPEGSGVFFEPGAATTSWVLTAAHIVDRATAIAIRLHNGEQAQAELAFLDSASDLAVLKVQVPGPSITVSRSPPEVGSHTCAVGNPFGLGISLSCGVVSAVGRHDIGFNDKEDFIQTDAAINPGVSGGALVDSEGRLIGLIDAIFTKEADIDAGVNFAISARLICEVVESWFAHRQ